MQIARRCHGTVSYDHPAPAAYAERNFSFRFREDCVAVVDQLADLPGEPAAIRFPPLRKAAELEKPTNFGNAFADVIGGDFNADQAPALRFGRESKRIAAH